MSLAIAAVEHRFNAAVTAELPILQAPKFPPPPPDPAAKTLGSSLAQLADEWCGTVPKRFPFPVPPKASLDDWCGTGPRPLPGPVPPTPPQPWLDLANAAQAFR